MSIEYHQGMARLDKLKDKACDTCVQRDGEECGLHGYEVYEDTQACFEYSEDEGVL